MLFRFLSLPFFFLLAACSPSIPQATTYEEAAIPPAPDYAQQQFWAALPTKQDEADKTPEGLTDQQATAEADVFYLHPTIYTDTKKGNDEWNASLQDEQLNTSVDESAMRNQASIFNAAGRVYAPRYRQAHLNVFRRRGTEVAERALDLAYTDILAAFDYFINNYNQGRPIIIASHSQGTVHAARLMKDRFEGKPLRDQLVVAYLIGMPVPKQPFSDIPVCDNATATGCFVSWRTYRDDYEPSPRDTAMNVTVVNPLSWNSEPGKVPASENKGGVLYKFDKILPNLVSAEIRGPRLYTNKPKFFGDIFFNTKNYHIGDLNLFWVNIRDNAVLRVENR